VHAPSRVVDYPDVDELPDRAAMSVTTADGLAATWTSAAKTWAAAATAVRPRLAGVLPACDEEQTDISCLQWSRQARRSHAAARARDNERDFFIRLLYEQAVYVCGPADIRFVKPALTTIVRAVRQPLTRLMDSGAFCL